MPAGCLPAFWMLADGERRRGCRRRSRSIRRDPRAHRECRQAVLRLRIRDDVRRVDCRCDGVQFTSDRQATARRSGSLPPSEFGERLSKVAQCHATPDGATPQPEFRTVTWADPARPGSARSPRTPYQRSGSGEVRCGPAVGPALADLASCVDRGRAQAHVPQLLHAARGTARRRSTLLPGLPRAGSRT
jgi:hypothetical protein